MRTRVSLLRKGFLPISYELYRLGENDPHDYLSDHQRELTWMLNWPFAAILDDKLGFTSMLRDIGVGTPEIRALVLDGRLEPLDGSGAEAAQWLSRELQERGRMVIKPIWGAKGKGILIIEPAEAGCTVNGEHTDFAAVQQRIAGMSQYLVTDFVEQADYSREIFPDSANSMRILTMRGRDDRRPFIAAAVHRFGRTSSGRIDNWSKGGLSAWVDLDSGEMGPGVTSAEFGSLVWHEHHPDSGARIEGTTIPEWESIREGVIDMAAKMPFLRYVGWDVVATPDGFSILEGNKQSHVNLMQVHRPLLRDPRIRSFYESEGILSASGRSADANSSSAPSPMALKVPETTTAAMSTRTTGITARSAPGKPGRVMPTSETGTAQSASAPPVT